MSPITYFLIYHTHTHTHRMLIYKTKAIKKKEKKIYHTILLPQQPKTLITSMSFAMMRGATSTGIVAVMVMMLVVLNQLESVIVNASSSNKTSCNIYRGSWVYDKFYPLYDSKSCPFIERQFNCKPNGRPDSDYLKYRWQPSGCNLPR